VNTNIPIGQRENQRLEFKSKEVLRRLPSVGREVVAMLNSDGGDVWIGLREADGVAVNLEPIENLDYEIGRLQDHFNDAIEMAPSPGEIQFEKIEEPGVGAVLRLLIRPLSNLGPRALRERAARLFIRRVGDRIRPMSHEEIAAKFTARLSRDDLASEAKRKMLDARDKWLGKGRALWLRIQPFNDLEIRPRSEDDFRKYFVDPLVTGNRATGWNFVNPYERIRREGGALLHGSEAHGLIRFSSDGTIEFTLPLEHLFWKSVTGRPDADTNEIWPYCLLEFPISIFRFASTVYRDYALQRVGLVLADMALFGLLGWTLRPHSPRSFGYKMHGPESFREENLFLPKPLTFQADEIFHEPDRCGFRLVAQIYERFGYWEKDIPQEFDRVSGRLVLPNE
jgi:hypothetical protein